MLYMKEHARGMRACHVALEQLRIVVGLAFNVNQMRLKSAKYQL